ncbi:MAG: hypothetical protein JRI68_22440 [Deltaproteobacteria bacterium]|nr:hypothetical protein [Deltaproteobacteria bacterium]
MVMAPVVLLTTVGVSACGLLGGLPGGSCDQLKSGNFASLKVVGGAEVKGKVVAFLESVVLLDRLVVAMETDLIKSCGELGYAIGIPAHELTAKPNGGKGAEAVCAKVSAKIEAVLEANANAELTVSLSPPRCYADVTAMTSCMAGCGAVIEPGELEASCEGGELAGTCSGECSGECSASGDVRCSGSCDGNCKGKCDGDPSSGKCNGSCEGSCSGGCKLEGSAKCEGTCTGECSVELKAPKCTGEFKPPNVDPSCHAKCSAKAAASAICEPPSVDIKVDGEANAELQRMIVTLQGRLPAILEIQLGTAARLEVAASSIISAGGELPSVAGEAGLAALGCIGAAVDMAAGASGSVSVNVEASASVSGSAGGG